MDTVLKRKLSNAFARESIVNNISKGKHSIFVKQKSIKKTVSDRNKKNKLN